MVARQFGAFDEAEIEQTAGDIEHRGYHIVQAEIGLGFGIIQRVLALSDLFRQVIPIPGLDVLRLSQPPRLGAQ